MKCVFLEVPVKLINTYTLRYPIGYYSETTTGYSWKAMVFWT